MHTLYTLTSQIPGPHLLILGSIHGNETAGSQGIDIFLRQVHDGQITLIGGSITCIPYANFDAYRRGVRYIQHDLNRIFDDIRVDDGSVEYQTAQYIKSHIREADFVLDLHTYHSGEGAFAFDDFEDEITSHITKCLPMDQIILGWTQLYDRGDHSGMDTIGYARSQGLVGVTIECGQHDDPRAIDIALESIISVGLTLCILEGIPHESPKQYIRMGSKVLKPSGGVLSTSWIHGDIIHPGDALCTIDGVTMVHSSNQPRVMVLPHHGARDGDEWYYIGEMI